VTFQRQSDTESFYLRVSSDLHHVRFAPSVPGFHPTGSLLCSYMLGWLAPVAINRSCYQPDDLILCCPQVKVK
jgi:hypothetical protein